MDTDHQPAALGRIFREPESVYRNNGAIGSSEINQFIQSEAHWAGLKSGKWPRRKETAALGFGRYAHTYVLQPELCDSQYVVADKVDGRTKEGKAYLADLAASSVGKEVIARDDADTVASMAEALSENALAAEYLNGDHEVTYRYADPVAWLSIQCRADIINESHGWIADLKTTDSLAKFRRSIIDLGYYRQAAHYREVVRLVLGHDEPFRFVFVAVEKSPPYAVGVFELDEDLLERGYMAVSSALKRIAAVKQGAVPKRDPPGITLIGMPRWMRGDADEPVVSALEEF